MYLLDAPLLFDQLRSTRSLLATRSHRQVRQWGCVHPPKARTDILSPLPRPGSSLRTVREFVQISRTASGGAGERGEYIHQTWGQGEPALNRGAQ